MNTVELAMLIEIINRQVRAIIKAQQVLAGVKQQLEENKFQPFEQDFIYADHFGSIPSEPKTQRINGVEFTTRILHKTGKNQSDISGGDLLYEIEDEKFAIIQYKRPERMGTVAVDTDQLDVLMNSCPVDCSSGNYIYHSRIIGWCGSWYGLRDGKGGRYFRACEIRAALGGKKSIHLGDLKRGLSMRTYNELFASCQIGASINPDAVREYLGQSLAHDRIVFSVFQRGMFDRKRGDIA